MVQGCMYNGNNDKLTEILTQLKEGNVVLEVFR